MTGRGAVLSVGLGCARRTIAAVVVAAGLGSAGCLGAGEAFVVRQPPHEVNARPESLAEGTLEAGTSEVDITPPPGLPTYGYSFSGQKAAKGYWMRLKARVIALERVDKRLALVQLDLGATSSILQRELARRLADLGLGPENLLIASTHTHAGPGGFFGERFFNGFVAATPGFDPLLVEHMAERIERGVRAAFADLSPARLRVAQVEVDRRASHNRSRPAWERNYADLGVYPPQRDVDPTLTLLRIDTSRDGAPFAPAAAWTIFGVHGTTVPGEYPLYHGDVHGYASRLIAAWARRKYGVDRFVAANANGAEGDVSPGDGSAGEQRNRDLTRRIAGYLADGAARAMSSFDCADGVGCAEADARAQAATFDVAYAEVSMRGANTRLGRLCQKPFIGAPVLAGSEEGRGPVQGIFGISEGSIRTPGDCDSTRIRGALFPGPIIYDLILSEDDFPDVLPFQVVTFRGVGAKVPELVLGMWPGEPTTEIALRAKAEMAARFGSDGARPPTAIVAHANGYALYFTTGSEFVAQHYEGGNSIYGPHQGQFAVEQLARLAGSLALDKPDGRPIVSYRPRRVFRPGEVTEMLPRGAACDPKRWGPLTIEQGEHTVTLNYIGAAPDERCELPSIALSCGGRILVDDEGIAQTDESVFFEVRNLDDTIWSATWTKRGGRGRSCAFVVRPVAGPAFHSEAFVIR